MRYHFVLQYVCVERDIQNMYLIFLNCDFSVEIGSTSIKSLGNVIPSREACLKILI